MRICGHSRDDLFPLLKIALSERFAAVPRGELIRDLLMPLKNALGNAYKHGHGRDATKTISVEIALGRKGALIAVTDEGPGFDVALTFRRFQEQENYFVNHGSGFRNLHRAASTVSFDNGGRTVLLCFQPALPDAKSPWPAGSPLAENSRAVHKMDSPEVGDARPRAPTNQPAGPTILEIDFDNWTFFEPTLTLDGNRPPGNVLDPAWMQARLSAEWPDLGFGRGAVKSCRIYPAGAPSGDDCGIRYVLRGAAQNGWPEAARILTGRLHATKAAADADFEAAAKLHAAALSKSVLIPRPIAQLSEEPRLVLYDFDSWMNLREYLSYRRSLKALRHAAERFGRALARLHRSSVEFPTAAPKPVEDQFAALAAWAEAKLKTRPDGPGLADRFRISVRRIQARLALARPHTLAPIHGAFGWNCIYYGVDGCFYLYRFETCRRSDPGLDLGRFAADLLRFAMSQHDATAYRLCRDAFLESYNGEAERPLDGEDLQFYMAIALSERLARSDICTEADGLELLSALDPGEFLSPTPPGQ